jgi:hypothetical protein
MGNGSLRSDDSTDQVRFDVLNYSFYWEILHPQAPGGKKHPGGPGFGQPGVTEIALG